MLGRCWCTLVTRTHITLINWASPVSPDNSDGEPEQLAGQPWPGRAHLASRGTAGASQAAPPPLTVMASDALRAFGAPNPLFSASYAGFRLGETPAALSVTLLLSAPAADASTGGGLYAIDAVGLSSPKYALNYVSGQLKVIAAPAQSELSAFNPQNNVLSMMSVMSAASGPTMNKSDDPTLSCGGPGPVGSMACTSR